jgi:hypothetical protein
MGSKENGQWAVKAAAIVGAVAMVGLVPIALDQATSSNSANPSWCLVAHSVSSTASPAACYFG